MTEKPHSDAERELVEMARRVLPAGCFGNIVLDTVIARGRGGRV